MGEIMIDKTGPVIPGNAESRLGEVIGSEGEELRLLGHFVGRDGSPGDLDHGTDRVLQLDVVSLYRFLRNPNDDFFLVGQFLHRSNEGNHDLGENLPAFAGQFTGRFKNGLSLHLDDLRKSDSQSTPPVPEHGIEFSECFDSFQNLLKVLDAFLILRSGSFELRELDHQFFFFR